MTSDTRHLGPAPLPPSEFDLLAQLAFASRRRDAETHGPRHLALLPPDALDMDLSDPSQRDFGDYELQEKIGQGGMGVVYRAHQRSLDRIVALKLLAAGPWASLDFVERFRREAQSAARLEHPNIVTVYENGAQGDLHYFSMRLIRGDSLAARLQQAPRPTPKEAARLLRIVAEALDYAHRLGVLHLDLKPGNVLMDEAGEPMVADFGLARRIDDALAEQGEDVSGTPSYMAPEQATARSQQIGRATDIYGLGSILYEMLTGEPPFLGANPQATLQRVVHEEVVPPREHEADIPRDLEAICLKCLAKDPEQRYASAGALAEDLRLYLEDRPVSVRPLGGGERIARWVRREPRLAAAVAAVALALIVGLVATTQQWRRAESNATTSRGLLWEGRREAALRLEQDGKGHDAQARLLDNLREQEAEGASDAAAMERRRIGMLLAQGAQLIDRTVIADASPMAVEVSPDGSRVAVGSNDLSVRWYDSATLEQQGRVELAGRASSDGQARAPILLRFAGANRLRVTLEWYGMAVNPGEGDTWLVDLEKPAVIEPPAAFADFADATYSADGRLALLRNRTGGIQVWNVEPWRALSALSTGQSAYLSWLLAPDGRHLLSFSTGARHLIVHELPDLSSPQSIEVPNQNAISAWALSGDGRSLALGDREGRVYMFDLATRVLRPLASGRGREILWLSFSEDDAWLASGNFDGTAQAFDVASGDALAAGQMRHDFPVQRVALSRAQRLLVVAGAGHTALWRLSRYSARALPPHRIGLAPAPHGLAARYPVGWSFQAGLLASAGMDGQLRLWRLPPSPTLEARAAHQVPEALRYHGRVVDIEWDRLRLVSSDGRKPSAWVTLPQPPGFAELVDQDRLLLLTTGPELRVYDTGTMRLRQPPLPLPDSPQRLLSNRDGSRVLLSFGAPGKHGPEGRLRLLDARTGTWLPGAATLSGMTTRLSWSNDERRLLAVGPPDGATTLLDVDGLKPIAEYPHDPFEPVVWGAFRGDRIALVTRADDRRLGSDSLLFWDAASDKVEQRFETGVARPRGVLAAGTGVLLLGAQHDLLLRADGQRRRLQRLAHSEPNALAVLSADGRLLARAFRHEVQLHDARSAELVGPPLADDSHPLDFIGAIAFSSKGDVLLARTMQGRWLRWPIAAEGRTTAALDADLRRLDAAEDGQRTLHPPTPDERWALRAADPGPWPAPAPRPAIALAPGTDPALAIPARAANTPAHLVDLGTVYEVGPDTPPTTYFAFRPATRIYPMGVQRMAGVEFEIRGAANVGQHAWDRLPGWSPSRRIQCLPLPPQQAAAISLLTGFSMPTPLPTGTPVARLTLHYLDGPSASVGLRAGMDVPGYLGEDAGVQWSFGPETVLPMSGYAVDGLLTPRLVNPAPQRTLRCMDLETVTGAAVLQLLAVTLQAPKPAVMAGAESSSSLQPATPPADVPNPRSHP